MTQFIIPSLRGLQFASTARIEGAYENMYTHGVNYYLALWHQWKQIGLACSYLGTLPPLGSGRYNISNYTLSLGLGCGLLNLFAAQYKHDYLKPQSSYLRKGLNFIAENSGKISQGAMLLTSIAKFILGQRVEAVAHLGMLSIQYLDKSGALPKKVNAIFRIYIPLIAIVSGIVLGTPFLQFICALNLVNLLIPAAILGLKWKMGHALDLFVNKNFASVDIHYPSLKEFETNEDTSDLVVKFNAKEIADFDVEISLLIDPSHVKRAKNINLNLSEDCNFIEGDATPFRPLLDLFDGISWQTTSSYQALEKYVIRDPKWQDFKKGWGPDTIRIEENKGEQPEKWETLLIQWTRTQLETFMENISGQKKPAGNLIGYRAKQNQCLQIINFIKSNKIDPIILEDILLTFAIAGGDYCVEAIEDAIQANFDRVLCLESMTNLDFRSRIDAKLFNRRKEAFIAVMMKISDSPHIPAPFKLNDRHNKNYFMQTFGQGLGLDVKMQEARDSLPVFIKWIISPFPFYRIGFWQNAYNQSSEKLDLFPSVIDNFFETVKKSFENVYDESVVLELIEELYDQKIISRQDILEWWQKYANKLRNSNDLLESVVDSESGAILPDGSLNKKYLKIMCIEMGYLKKPDLIQKLLT